MKKIFTLIAGLMTCAAAYALPVGNPSAPDLLKYGLWSCGGECWGLKIGYRGDFVANRKMKLKEGPKFNDFNIATNAGVLTLNLWDRVDLYGWAGESSAGIATSVLSGLPVDIELGTKEGFAWGAGIKAILWKSHRTSVGIDAQYGHFKSKFNHITLAFEGVFLPFDPSLLKPLRYQEYQISLAVSHRICSLVPYVALQYSSVQSYIRDASLDLRNHKKWGFTVGTSLVDSERMSVTAEGRFYGERALSILADIRF